jgi:excisionase family DNA binding protein
MTTDLAASTPDIDLADSDVLTVTEAAHLLDVSERTARRYAATGKLDAERVTAPDGRPEWRIHRRSIDLLPATAKADRAGGGRRSADTVPATLYREAQAQLSAALIQIGQLTEVRERLLLTERTESTLREQVTDAQTHIADLERQQPRRRWFGRRR